jgi:tRNA-specific adenosine deaminase 3
MEEFMPYDLACTSPPLVPVYVLTVRNLAGSQILKELSQAYDLEDLSHCKRIRKHSCEGYIEVLLAKPALVTAEDLQALKAKYESCPLCEFIVTVEVPAIAPKSRSQTDIWSTVWPCVYKVPSFEPLVHSQEELDFVTAVLHNMDDDCALLFNSKDKSTAFARTSRDPLGHCVMEAIHQYKGGEDQYYCSDCWLLTNQEPCIMCGMALVHSRVSRVYFRSASERGAFTEFALHLQPVNYMYRVFRLT